MTNNMPKRLDHATPAEIEAEARAMTEADNQKAAKARHDRLAANIIGSIGPDRHGLGPLTLEIGIRGGHVSCWLKCADTPRDTLTRMAVTKIAYDLIGHPDAVLSRPDVATGETSTWGKPMYFDEFLRAEARGGEGTASDCYDLAEAPAPKGLGQYEKQIILLSILGLAGYRLSMAGYTLHCQTAAERDAILAEIEGQRQAAIDAADDDGWGGEE